MQNTQFNINQELAKLWNHKKTIAIFTIGVGILVAIYTLFLEDEYSSNAIFIPPNFSDVKSMTYTKARPLSVGAGGDVDIERMITILSSDNVNARLIKKFNLYKHYEIDTSDLKAAYKKISSKLSDNIKISTMKYTAVQVIAFDKDPKMAKDIADELLLIADSLVESIAKRKQNLEKLNQNIKEVYEQRQKLIDSLTYYRKNYNIYHFDNMSDAIANQLANRMNDPKFTELYDKVYSLEIRLNRLDDLYNLLLEERELRQRHLEAVPSLIDVVNQPVLPVVKTRPQRMLIVFSSMFLAFIAVCIYVIFKEQEKVYVI
jgi:uncharacterized protein involved in exopolysaccharide biosynthesis